MNTNLEGDPVGYVKVGFDQPVACHLAGVHKLLARSRVEGVQGALE